MPRSNPLPPYTCPRCGYQTRTVSCIKQHFNRKTVCKSEVSEIELTEEIKRWVIENRVYQELPSSKTVVNQIVNITYSGFCDEIKKATLKRVLQKNETWEVVFLDEGLPIERVKDDIQRLEGKLNQLIPSEEEIKQLI
jgi:hypothetical protein